MRTFTAATIVAWVMWVCAAATASAATCGNGVIESPDEDCDPGGLCIGSDNAGAHCTAASDCAGGVCKTFGGYGCAANCTTEHDAPYALVPGVVQGLNCLPGTSCVIAYAFIQLPIPLSGALTARVGKERNGMTPIVVPADSLHFPAIPVLGQACGCVHGAIAKTCGGTFYEPDNTVSTVCTDDDSKCAGKKPCTFVNGPGNTASGVIGCDGLDGTNLSYTIDGGGDTGMALPPVVMQTGHGGPGSAAVLTTIGINVVLGACTGTSADYGPDGLFCTADDQSNLGASATLPAVTGTATAHITNLPDGGEIGPIDITGTPFSCSAVASGNPGGASLVSAFALTNVPTIGSLAVTVNLIAQPAPTATPTPIGGCVGDCDGGGDVTVNELISMVNIALGQAPLSSCTAGDADGSHDITVDEIVAAVTKALSHC